MNKLKLLLISAILLFFSSLSSALCIKDGPEKDFYLGIDYVMCKTCFHNHGGSRLFKAKSSGANPFIGIMLSELVSLESGYQYITSSKVSVIEHGGHVGGGIVVPAVAHPITFKSSLTLKGPYLGLSLKTPNAPFAPVNVFVGFGVSITKAEYERKTFQIGPMIGWTTRKFEKTRTLEKWTAGANFEVSNDFGVRAYVSVLNTGKLSAFASDDAPTSSNTKVKIIPKDMVCYNLGLFWKF